MNNEEAILHYYLTWNILKGKPFKPASPPRKYTDNFTKITKKQKRFSIIDYLYNNNLDCRKCLLDRYAFQYRLPVFDSRNIPDLGPFFRFYDDPTHPNRCIHNLSAGQCCLCLGFKDTVPFDDPIFSYRFSSFQFNQVKNHFTIYSPEEFERRYTESALNISPVTNKIYRWQLGRNWPDQADVIKKIRHYSGSDDCIENGTKGERFSIELRKVFPPIGHIERDPVRAEIESVYYRNESIVKALRNIIKYGVQKDWIPSKTFESDVCCNDTELMRDIRRWSQTGKWESKILLTDGVNKPFEVDVRETKVFRTDGSQVERFWDGVWCPKKWKWNNKIRKKVELISERSVNPMWAFNLNESGAKINRAGDQTQDDVLITRHNKVKLGKKEIRIDGEIESVKLDSEIKKVWVWASHGIPYQCIGNIKVPIKDSCKIKKRGNLYALIYPEWEIETLHRSSIDRGWNWLFEKQNYSMTYPEDDLSPGLHIWKKFFFINYEAPEQIIDSGVTEEDGEEREPEAEEEDESIRAIDRKWKVWKSIEGNWESWHGSGDDPEDITWGYKKEIRPYIPKYERDDSGSRVLVENIPWHENNEYEIIDAIDNESKEKQKGKENLLKQIDELQRKEGLGVIEIAERLGLDKSTISKNIDVLKASDIFDFYLETLTDDDLKQIFGSLGE